MDQQSMNFMQTTETKPCPFGIMIETVECTSRNEKHIKREEI